MRILYLGLVPPIPTTNGHRFRFRNLLSALVEEGHEVALLCYAEDSEAAQPAPEVKKLCTQVRLIAAPRKQSMICECWGRVCGLFSSTPYGAQRFYCERMRHEVQRTLARQRFEAIVCDDIYMFSNLPPEADIPVLLNKDDITYEVMERFLGYEKNVLKRFYGRLEQKKVHQLELQACAQSDAVLACSERDADLIRSSCPRACVEVLPNVVDVDSYQPCHDDDERTQLFVGAMDWLPNRDAIEYYINKILPLVRRLAPNARFVVAGRNPSPDLQRRYSSFKDVDFTGSVADMRAIIASAAVCVVPLRIGSGTRMKILEAGAMGKPIISTTLGAEGLDFIDGSEILIADQPEAFAEAVVQLLTDPARRRSLGHAARRRVEQQYSMSVLRHSLKKLRVLEQGRQPKEMASVP